MKEIFKYFFILLPFLSNSQTTPKLVVSIVVDQMRYEYVDRFWDEYSENGLKKLVKQGVFCRNTHYNYIPTYTGPGHASIFTGTTPSVHGIIGNNWYDKDDFSAVYCSGDGKYRTICLCKKPHEKSNPGNGKMSPNLLLCNTVGDQLKLKDSLSKVFGVSIKDRGAILSAGFLVLTLSTFTPTVEFGMLSVITIITALIGDLTFLPALLSQIKPKIKN